MNNEELKYEVMRVLCDLNSLILNQGDDISVESHREGMKAVTAIQNFHTQLELDEEE